MFMPIALPTWDELVTLTVRCHEGGCRCISTGHAYDRPLAEIAALADSVHVSF